METKEIDLNEVKKGFMNSIKGVRYEDAKLLLENMLEELRMDSYYNPYKEEAAD